MKINFIAPILCVITLSMGFVARSQTNMSDSLLADFKFYYHHEQADSIYAMFSEDMREALSLSATKTFLEQLKQQLGEIKGSSRLTVNDGSTSSYMLNFERPIVEIAITFKDNLIVGIRQKVPEEAKGNTTDNISVGTSYGEVYGTVRLPNEYKEGDKVPIVLLIAGSGPTDRDMNQLPNIKTNSFKLLAEELAKEGVASLRFDKRGVGKSISSQKQSSVVFSDFADDVSLFMKKIRADSRFSTVTLLGHSEGSTIGLLASQSQTPDAFVSLCGPATNLPTILRKQLKASLPQGDYERASVLLDSLKAGKLVTATIPSSVENIFHPNMQPFLISSLKYNATDLISTLNIPVIIISGTNDLQISEDEARELLKANNQAKRHDIAGMNHVLKSVGNDHKRNMQSYGDETVPLHRELVSVLVDFIKAI